MSQSQHERILPAWFCRGGTSNGLVLTRAELPPEPEWPGIFSAAMGSPDSYGRQLNGMGSGISSTSKIIVLGPPTRDDVDVDYTFVQVGIKDGSLDKAGNCGNMSSLVGPMALDKGMIPDEKVAGMVYEDEKGQKWARVRLFNTNTNKVLESRFRVEGEPPKYCPRGDYAMDGVPSTGSMIRLSFLDPAGAKTGKALPTGRPTDNVTLPDGRSVAASLVDVSNPGVFVRAEDMLALAGKPQSAAEAARGLNPAVIEADESLKKVLEEVRQAGASMMGLDPQVQSIPKVVMLLPPNQEEQVDVRCLALSMGQAHKAVPLTLALCLGAACQVRDSIAWRMLSPQARDERQGETAAETDETAPTTKTVTIGHASGKLDIGITLEGGKIVSADLLRTARVLMKGDVLY
ncbi:prpF protein [Sarocladium implicatum]|nr:prpF protein [Sarocladium implicatum]